MPKVTYYSSDGATGVLEVEPGTSVMRAAVENGIGGIVGECGGAAMCATCHVYVREPYLEKLPEVGEDEDEMLECTAEERDETRSRLGCQIKLGADLEEIEIDLPARQV